MRTIGIISFLLLIGLAAKTQPPINNWYSFGRTQSILGSVIATDSCYYAIGLGASTVPGIWDAGFYKIGFDGNIMNESYLHNDTVSINHMSVIGNPFIATSDGNFAALAGQLPYFRFIKYSPSGDTIFTRLITEFYLIDNYEAVQPADILQINPDSSFTCSAWIGDNSLGQSGVILFNLSKNGDLNFYNVFFSGNVSYKQHIPAGLVNTTNGYILSTTIFTAWGYPIDELDHLQFITLDQLGNELNTQTFWGQNLEAFPKGFIQTEDGGFIHGGIVGKYSAPLNTNKFLGQIVKLDQNLDRVWQLTLGDSMDMNYIQVNNIVLVDNGYIASGYSYADSMICGWMFNINDNGQVIWDSYFSYVPDTSFNFPEHRFYDFKKTADNGFIMVGEAWNAQATLEGTPGRFAWLVKTDSVGCLVPGCQDFLEITKSEMPLVKLSAFPNPTSGILNIHYYDPNFSGKAKMLVYDLNGREVKSWNLFSNDMTYIYDASHLKAGTYILQITENGQPFANEKFIIAN